MNPKPYVITSSAVHLVSEKPCTLDYMWVHSGEGTMRIYDNKAASRLVAIIPIIRGTQELNFRLSEALTIDTSEASNVNIEIQIT